MSGIWNKKVLFLSFREEKLLEKSDFLVKFQGQLTINNSFYSVSVIIAPDSYLWMYFKEMWWIWTWSDENWAIYCVSCHSAMFLGGLAMFGACS